jgi:hypothetical protein
MMSDATGTITFGYGTGTSGGLLASASPADPQSSYTTDGAIKIVVARSALGDVRPDQKLTDFLVRIRVEAGAVALTPDNMPDSLARTGSYTVKGSENCVVPKPDLAISGSDITYSGLEGQGAKQVIVAVVHNIGTADAYPVQVRITVDGRQVHSVQTIGRIAPGSTKRASVIWDSKKGQHTLGATADPANVIAESNEGNNSGFRTVTIG